MAQQMIQLDREKLICSICLELFKDPVTIPCGHSYCMSCIKDFWDGEDQKRTHSCPQCRHSLMPRPALVKNSILAELVEDLKRIGLQAASPDHSFAGPKDVPCDFCTGRKLKASKSCLVCLASYCEEHLQSHYNVAPLKRHKLVEATLNIQGIICPRHDEVMKIFCRTDHQCICYLCLMDEHEGHDTVSAAAELAEKQMELSTSLQKIQQRIQEREGHVKVTQQEMEAINHSAEDAVRDSEEMFTEQIRFIEKKSSEVKQQIGSQQKTEVSRVKELQEEMHQEITELKSKEAELKQHSLIEDHIHFLNNYPSLSCLTEFTDLPSVSISPLRHFEDVKAAVSEATEKLKAVMSEEWHKITFSVTTVDVLLPHKEPTTRPEFLMCFRQITLDPNTTNTRVFLSEENRKVKSFRNIWSYPSHPDRFLEQQQVLSTDGLTGRCYWEVEWSGIVVIAVAYKDISRTGTMNECAFGYNDKSWALKCFGNGYTFGHDDIQTAVSGPHSSRVGVYLDLRAGTLSFYSISETMTLLHRVHTKFTQPLYLGFWFPSRAASTAEISKLK